MSSFLSNVDHIDFEIIVPPHYKLLNFVPSASDLDLYILR